MADVKSDVLEKVILVAFISCMAAFALDVHAEIGDKGHAATVTWRIHERQWKNEEALAKLLAFLDAHPMTGKIALFTCPSHVPPKPENFYPLMPQLMRAISAFRSRGYKVGINHLCTIGQTDEDLDRAFVVEGAQYIVNWKGVVGKSARCPMDPVWREKYVKPVYTALARTKPDFIWTDDDIGRLSGHGVPGPGCFCPICLRRLRDRLGYDGTDTKGLEEFFSDIEKGEERRRAMMALNRETFPDLLSYIRSVVHAVDPKIALGVMDSQTAYTGNGFAEKYHALAPSGTEDVYFRPGGGFYDDRGGLAGALRKANQLGYESAYIPDAVAVNESEIETFQYQVLYKSNFSLKTESLLYLAAGTRGTAWNVFPIENTETYEVVGSRIDACERVRPEADALVEACGMARPRGVWNGRGRDYFVGNNAGGRTGSWFADGWDEGIWDSELQTTGIPLAYREEECEVCAPTLTAVWSWTREELERRLSGGLYLSVPVAQAIAERGYGTDLGFKILKPLENKDAREAFVDHPINEGAAGFLRDMRQSFWGGNVVGLEPLPGAEILTRAVNAFDGRELARCVAGVYENARGGRVYLTGAFAWDRMSFSPTVRHRKNVMDWLSRGRLSGVIDSYHKAVLWMRGDQAAVVFNMSFDPAETLELLLRGDRWTKGLRMVGKHAGVVMGMREGNRLRFCLPTLAPWSVTAFVPVSEK